jgi:hypothetical protein
MAFGGSPPSLVGGALFWAADGESIALVPEETDEIPARHDGATHSVD